VAEFLLGAPPPPLGPPLNRPWLRTVKGCSVSGCSVQRAVERIQRDVLDLTSAATTVSRVSTTQQSVTERTSCRHLARCRRGLDVVLSLSVSRRRCAATMVSTARC